MFEVETKKLVISGEGKYHKECKTSLSFTLFTDDKGNKIVMNSEERISDKVKIFR